MEATQVTDLLEETWRSTIEVGHDLQPDEWQLPSECPGWTVKDHVSHVIGTERVLQGLPRSDADPGAPTHVKNTVGEFNEREVELRRPRAGADVLAELEELVELRLATLRAGDDAFFAQHIVSPTGPGTMLDFLDIRVLDCFVHEQDVRRATARPGHLGGGPAEHTVDRLVRTLPIVVGKRAAAPEGSTSVIAIDDPVTRVIPVRVDGGRAKVVDTAPEAPIVTVRMDTQTFLALATGRWGPDAPSARLVVEGDTALGEAIASSFNMMI